MKSFEDSSPSITGPLKVMLSVSVPLKAGDQELQLLKIPLITQTHPHNPYIIDAIKYLPIRLPA